MDQRHRFQDDPLNVLALVIVLFGFVMVGVFFVVRANTPSDGARMIITDPVWKNNSVIVTRWEPNPDGTYIRLGVVSVEGVEIADLAQAAVTGDPMLQRAELQQKYQAGQEVVYAARRARRDDTADALLKRPLLPIRARLGPFPWGVWAQQNWLVIASSIGCLLIAGYVFYRRPGDRTTRAMILWIPGLWASQVMYSLGLQVGDFIHPANLWLFMVTASAGYILTLIAIVRFAFEFTRPPERVAPVLRNWRSIAATYFVPYAFFVIFLAWQWIVDPHALRWFGKWRWATAIIAVSCIGLAVLVSVYSYVNTRDNETRKKVRWIVYTGGLVGALSLVVVSVPALLIGRPLTDLAANSVLFLVFMLAIAYAILRYRYLELDVIVNRTLVIGVMTAALAVVYFSALVVMQLIFGPRRGTNDSLSDIVIVLTTLIGIALFKPVRHVAQRLVDRAFYRGKYEASKRIAGFTAALRDDKYANMSVLTSDLLDVSRDVARSDGAGLWLREPATPRGRQP
jgi:hypothetical protein